MRRIVDCALLVVACLGAAEAHKHVHANVHDTRGLSDILDQVDDLLGGQSGLDGLAGHLEGLENGQGQEIGNGEAGSITTIIIGDGNDGAVAHPPSGFFTPPAAGGGGGGGGGGQSDTPPAASAPAASASTPPFRLTTTTPLAPFQPSNTGAPDGGAAAQNSTPPAAPAAAANNGSSLIPAGVSPPPGMVGSAPPSVPSVAPLGAAGQLAQGTGTSDSSGACACQCNCASDSFPAINQGQGSGSDSVGQAPGSNGNGSTLATSPTVVGGAATSGGILVDTGTPSPPSPPAQNTADSGANPELANSPAPSAAPTPTSSGPSSPSNAPPVITPAAMSDLAAGAAAGADQINISTFSLSSSIVLGNLGV